MGLVFVVLLFVLAVKLVYVPRVCWGDRCAESMHLIWPLRSIPVPFELRRRALLITPLSSWYRDTRVCFPGTCFLRVLLA